MRKNVTTIIKRLEERELIRIDYVYNKIFIRQGNSYIFDRCYVQGDLYRVIVSKYAHLVLEPGERVAKKWERTYDDEFLVDIENELEYGINDED